MIYPGIDSLVQIAYGTSFSDILNAVDTYSKYTKMIDSQSLESPDQSKSSSEA